MTATEKTSLPRAVSPVFADPGVDHGAHVEPTAEIWYVTCRLEHDGRIFGVQVMVTTSPSGRVFSSVSLTDSSSGAYRTSTTRHDSTSARLAPGRLDIEAGNVILAGPPDAMRLRAAIDGDVTDLVLRPRHPVLYSCGTGMFPYFHGPTYQYAMPGVFANGTVTIAGTTLAVTGSGWYDRQWSASRDAFGMKNAFTWFGLWLDDGVTMSVWDTTEGDWGDGRAWATIGAPDGTHTIAALTPVARLASGTQRSSPEKAPQPACWVLDLPGVGGELEVRHERIHDEARFYSGLCTVTGRLWGRSVNGEGVVDTVSR